MPKSSQAIEAELNALGALYTFGTKKEIKSLPEIMTDDESIKYLTSGLMDGNTWLVICTSRRIIFLDKGLLYGLKQIEIPLDKINSISHKTGLLLGEIHIWHGATQMQIKNCKKDTVKPFVDAVNVSIDSQKKLQSGATQTTNSAAEQIEKLASLLEKGLLTREEFDLEKKKLLNK